MFELLTPSQMGQADQLTIDGGIPGIELMGAAGKVLFDAVLKHFGKAQRVLVLCGPGNNGGDGYVVGRMLHEAGRRVDVFSPLGNENLSGDARLAFLTVPSDVSQISEPDWPTYDLVVDALFGAGLVRNVEGRLAQIIRRVNKAPAKVLAVDLPSGINGATGGICGEAVMADATATFFRCKPGHLLLPGRSHCGNIEVGQIGIANKVLADINVDTFINSPALWRPHYPIDAATENGRAASTVATGSEVPEAPAASAIVASREELATRLPQFSELASNLDMARAVARHFNMVTVLNEPDTVIAEPGGRASIAENLRPNGQLTDYDDVFARLLADLTSRNMGVFYAACAAEWILAEAQNRLASKKLSLDADQTIRSVIEDLQRASVNSK